MAQGKPGLSTKVTVGYVSENFTLVKDDDVVVMAGGPNENAAVTFTWNVKNDSGRQIDFSTDPNPPIPDGNLQANTNIPNGQTRAVKLVVPSKNSFDPPRNNNGVWAYAFVVAASDGSKTKTFLTTDPWLVLY